MSLAPKNPQIMKSYNLQFFGSDFYAIGGGEYCKLAEANIANWRRRLFQTSKIVFK